MDIRKNTREWIRVERTQFNGYELVDLRVWYTDKPGEDGKLCPSRKGVAFNVELLPEIIDALKQLDLALETN